MRKFIDKEIDRLVKKHGTNNPFIIAKGEGIVILNEELYDIRGYYNKFVKQKFIHLNNKLEDKQEIFVCSHELAHAILHADFNTPFLMEKTLFSIDRFEIEANYFAIRLYLYNKMLNEYENYTLEEIACTENIPLALLKLYFKVL